MFSFSHLQSYIRRLLPPPELVNVEWVKTAKNAWWKGMDWSEAMRVAIENIKRAIKILKG